MKQFTDWGPYLSFGVNSSSEMRISWESELWTTSRWLCYGKTPECNILIKEDWVESTRHHCIILTELKPDTQYYYKISRDATGRKNVKGITLPVRAADLKVDQHTYTFHTAPQEHHSGPFSFCIMGDIHSDHRNITPGFRAIQKNVPGNRFLISLGDAVNDGLKESSWQNYFQQTTPYMTSTPTMNSTGNHETGNPAKYARFLKTWDHPYVNPRIGGYYYFIYDNAVCIMLDSNNAGLMEGVISDYQMDWLEEVLEQFAKREYWIFIFLHHQIYSTGDFGMPHMYHLAYRDLFDEYRVDGVFYGHDHHFEVFWTGRERDWGGTHYCVVGTGGSNLDTHIRNPNRKPSPPNYIWKDRTYSYDYDGILPGESPKAVRNDEIVSSSQVFGILEHGFLNVTIEGDECELKFIGWENQVYYRDRIKRTGTGKRYHHQPVKNGKKC